MWPPYFCSIWPWPYSEIHVYIPHNRLNRLNFPFGHSVFSLLMVNSKGGSSSILILFSGMKSTSKFPALKSKAILGCFLPFSKFLLFWFALTLCGDNLFSEIKTSRRWIVKYYWNTICENFAKTNTFYLSFSTLFLDSCKSISQQNLVVKALFRNTLSFLYVWFCTQGANTDEIAF